LIDARSVTEIFLVSHVHIGFLFQYIGAERGSVVDKNELIVCRESLDTFDTAFSDFSGLLVEVVDHYDE
jgi:hypothetical protein